MSLLWYVNRLRSMPPLEVAHRVGESVKRSAARGRLEGWERYRVSEGVIPALPGFRESLLARAGEPIRRAVAEASRELLAGRFRALGVEWPTRPAADLFPRTAWRLDPVSGTLWPGPERFCADIRYRHQRTLGDVKYVWEFNRLQFLQVLAAHVALTGDEAARAVIEKAIDSWFTANPPFRGVAWTSGIELAMRSISLLVVASLAGGALSPRTIACIRTILNAHAFWMRRFPSRFSSANNHLIAEAAGQFLIGLAMPDTPEASSLESEARHILEREACKQLLADGVPAEQTPTYGAFTAEFLLLCLTVAAKAERPMSEGIRARLVAFADFVAWLSDGRGNVPGIGDDDEGRVLVSGRHEDRYVASVASCIGALRDPHALAADLTAASLRTAVFGATRTLATPGDGLRTFEQGGYSVVRERRADRAAILVFDHGPLGYLSIAAHGHADALAFTLSIDDRPIVVDAGTYLYHSGGAWRDWFRGTRAHNTLALGGADQSIISGPFNWSHKAACRLEESRSGPDWMLRASHDGYVSRFGVRHERTITAAPRGYEIVDRLIGPPQKERASVAFLLAPECTATPFAGGASVSVDGVAVLAIRTENAEPLLIDIGAERHGWFSPGFGSKVPTSVIRWESRVPTTSVKFHIDLK